MPCQVPSGFSIARLRPLITSHRQRNAPIAATASSKTIARVCGGATASGTASSCMADLGVAGPSSARDLLLRAHALEFLDQVLADFALGLGPGGKRRLLKRLFLRRREVD